MKTQNNCKTSPYERQDDTHDDTSTFQTKQKFYIKMESLNEKVLLVKTEKNLMKQNE